MSCRTRCEPATRAQSGSSGTEYKERPGAFPPLLAAERKLEALLDHTLLDDLVEISPDGSLKLARELIGLFFNAAPERVDQMRYGINTGSPLLVLQAAHALKGGAGTLGAARLVDLCARLELLGKEGSLRGAPPLVDAIELELPGLARTLDASLQRLENVSRARLQDSGKVGSWD